MKQSMILKNGNNTFMQQVVLDNEDFSTVIQTSDFIFVTGGKVVIATNE